MMILVIMKRCYLNESLYC